MNNTKYYVRAYAINNYGTGYGEVKNFTTLKKADEVGRDELIGDWQFISTNKSTEGQSYVVTISKDLSSSGGVILENFGNPGPQITAKGVVTSGQIIVASQNMSNGWIIAGLGKIVDVANTSMTWTYSITVGGDKDDYIATATKK